MWGGWSSWISVSVSQQKWGNQNLAIFILKRINGMLAFIKVVQYRRSSKIIYLKNDILSR